MTKECSFLDCSVLAVAQKENEQLRDLLSRIHDKAKYALKDAGGHDCVCKHACQAIRDMTRTSN